MKGNELIERLTLVVEGMEAGLDDWPISSQIFEYRQAIAEITRIAKQRDELVSGLNEILRAYSPDTRAGIIATKALASVKSTNS